MASYDLSERQPVFKKCILNPFPIELTQKKYTDLTLAIRYIINGTMLANIKEMIAELPEEANAALKARVEALIPVYEEALATVKALDKQDAIDFLSRRLYDMTAELVMSLLIIRDAAKAPELFEKSAVVYVGMTEEDVAGKAAYIRNFDTSTLDCFRAE